MRKKALVLFVVALTGCASSGPIPIGNNNYMLSKQSAGGIFVTGSTVKADLMKEGHSFCQGQGKGFRVVNATEQNAIPFARMPSAEVQFTCVEEVK